MKTQLNDRWIMILAFAAVYLIWGSTYFAIRVAIETLPSWGLAGTRFLVAGLLMLGLSRLAKEPKLNRHEIRYALITGILLMVANAVVCFVEKWIPSSIVAVSIGAMPIWVLALGRLFFNQPSPSLQKWLGAIVGLAGVAIIAFSQSKSEQVGVGKYAIFILFLSSWMWGLGTVLQRRVVKTSSPFLYSGLQMLFGAVAVLGLSVAFQEPAHFKFAMISHTSVVAWLYLVVFGSIIAFTAFSWLGQKVEPHILSTYALVNPVIAVALGWAFANETVNAQFIVATILVCAGLALLLLSSKKSTLLKRVARSGPPRSLARAGNCGLAPSTDVY